MMSKDMFASRASTSGAYSIVSSNRAGAGRPVRVCPRCWPANSSRYSLKFGPNVTLFSIYSFTGKVIVES